MATARGAAVPLQQTAKVEHAPMAWDSHGDAPAARAAPAGRHAEFPFPVKAFYIGAPVQPSRPSREPVAAPLASRARKIFATFRALKA